MVKIFPILTGVRRTAADAIFGSPTEFLAVLGLPDTRYFDTCVTVHQLMIDVHTNKMSQCVNDEIRFSRDIKQELAVKKRVAEAGISPVKDLATGTLVFQRLQVCVWV